MNRRVKGILAAATVLVVTAAAFIFYRPLRDIFAKRAASSHSATHAESASRQTNVSPFEIVNWDVEYRDAKLGPVRGVAVVDWEKKKAHVTFTGPTDGGKHILSTRELDVQQQGSETNVFFDFDGESPSSEKVEPPSTAGIPAFPMHAEDVISTQPTDTELKAQAKIKARADLNRVKVNLHVTPGATLVGTWSYHADPLTERDRDGKGRVGAFGLLNSTEIESRYEGFLGQQTGVEVWTPRPPQFAAVAVLEDQLGYKRGRTPLFEYPFSDSVSPQRTEEIRYRTLMVVGSDLPVDDSRPVVPPDANEPGVGRISVIAISDDPGLSPETAELFLQGWQRILLRQTPEVQAHLKQQQAALLRVELKEGVLPGPKTFLWGGASGSWALAFGNTAVEARFVRPLKQKNAADPNSIEEVEQVPVAYLPESLQVELETQIPLPIDSLTVLYGSAAGSSWNRITATRVPGLPSLYRTPPIALLEPNRNSSATASGGSIVAGIGDQLLATVDRRDLRVEFSTEPLAKLPIARSPGTKTPAQPGILWKDELAKAAQCKGISITDWSTIATKQEEEIIHTIWAESGFLKSAQSQSGQRKTLITVGDHAAMLLLRDSFVEMLSRQQQVLADMVTDDAIRGYREGIKRHLYANSDSAIAQIEVPGPNGGTAHFIDTLLDDYASDVFSGSDGIEKRDRWQVAATRAAIAKYREAINDSKQQAEAIASCDVKPLLALTGADFDNVIADALPRLMRLQDTSASSFQWVPDNVARAEVQNLAPLVAEIKATEEYSSIDKKLAVGVMLAPLGLAGMVGRVILLAATCLQLDVEAAGLIYDRFQIHKEVQFEFGASAVLGTERLEAAEMKNSQWWQHVSDLAESAALTALDLKALGSEFGQELSVFRGRQLWPVVEKGGVQALRGMNAKQQRDVMAYLADLRVRLRQNQAVSWAGERAMVKARLLANEVGGTRGPPAEPRTASLEPFEYGKTAVEPPFAMPGDARVYSVRELPLKTNPHGEALFIASPEDAAEQVVLDLGEKKGAGAYSTVYSLLDETRRPVLRDGKPVVIKILSKAQNGFDKDDLPGILRRMQRSQDLLKQAGIDHFPILEFHPEGRQPYVIQAEIPKDSPDFRVFSVSDFTAPIGNVGNQRYGLRPYEEISKVFTPEHQEALVKLYRKLADNQLLAIDLSLPNVYFRRTAAGWTAGVLDVDYVIPAAQPGTSYAATRAKEILTWGESTGKNIRTGLFSMLAENLRPWEHEDKTFHAENVAQYFLEYWHGGQGGVGYIAWDGAKQDFDPVFIDPNIVRKYFKNLPGPNELK